MESIAFKLESLSQADYPNLHYSGVYGGSSTCVTTEYLQEQCPRQTLAVTIIGTNLQDMSIITHGYSNERDLIMVTWSFLVYGYHNSLDLKVSKIKGIDDPYIER